MKNIKFLMKEANDVLSKTTDTRISFELLAGNDVIDLAKTEKKAKKWLSDIEKTGLTNASYRPIVIDIFDGTLITEKNIHLYLTNGDFVKQLQIT